MVNTIILGVRTLDYRKIYNNIISHRQTNLITEGYSERHHILPRSLGGLDEDTNLVRLTAREHFICHCLLAKMYKKYTFEWYKMNHSLLMMKSSSNKQTRYMNSYLYEQFRKNFSGVMREVQTGHSNSQYGTRWIHSLTERRSQKIPKEDPLPQGWEEGRVIKWDNESNKPRRLAVCKGCGVEFSTESRKKYCSEECKKQHSPSRNRSNFLTGREEEFFAAYDETNSMNKALKKMGLDGAMGGYYHTVKKLLDNRNT